MPYPLPAALLFRPASSNGGPLAQDRTFRFQTFVRRPWSLLRAAYTVQLAFAVCHYSKQWLKDPAERGYVGALGERQQLVALSHLDLPTGVHILWKSGYPSHLVTFGIALRFSQASKA